LIAKKRHFPNRSIYIALAAAMLLFLSGSIIEEPCYATAGTVGGCYTVTKPTCAVRQSTNPNSSALVTLKKGATVQLLAVSGSYFKVAASRGVVGYCPASSLARASVKLTSATKQAVTMDWPSRFINTSVAYNYQACMQDMQEIDAYYPNTRIETIGNSVWGNPIKALVIGRPTARKKILVQATIHSREVLTAQLALRQAENLLEAASRNALYGSMKVSDLINQVEIWVVPISNPDGVRLLREGLNAVPQDAAVSRAAILQMNDGRSSFTQWKANGRGVDLNRNFDGNWQIDPHHPRPDSEGYAGSFAFSEPEAAALRDLTLAKNFTYSVSYHASGNMFYWYDPYNSSINSKDQALAAHILLLTGYAKLPISKQVPNGGYRDWINLRIAVPSFTIEVGSVPCPLPQSQFPSSWLKNRHVILRLAATLFPNSITDKIK
jgi:hypothetical protein